MQVIRSRLKKVIQDLYGLDFDPEITPSPANIPADYSSNAPLKLAKELHKPPLEIANELATAMVSADVSGAGDGGGPLPAASRGRGREVRQDPPKVTISSPGFINFTLSDDYLSEQINELSLDFINKIKSNEYQDQTIICEFSDPNPFKVLHVGHLYTSIVGDAISRLFEYSGAKVIRANFGGDVGLHVAKTMYALLQKDTSDLKIEDIAECYIEGTALYDEYEHAHAEIIKLNKEIYQINADGIHRRVTSSEGAPCESLSGGEEDGRTRPKDSLAALYWKGRELSYDYFRNFYAQIGVKFDKYYPESTVAALGLAKVKEQLDKGVYEYSDGAVIFDGDKYGLHTRVFINKEGVPTYETKDVGLIFTKWEDYHFDKSVVITGNEQKDYMSVVLKSVEQYAPELVERTVHLTHGLVKLPGGVKMSSRKGNFLKAVDVLNMVKDELQSEYNSTDPKVALAATKYAFLKYKMGGQIIFDPHESVKMTGNSGPYLLYSAVRAKKILDNSKHGRVTSLEGNPKNARVIFGEGKGPAGLAQERNLAKKLLEYEQTLDEAVAEMAPHKVANYLYELAQEFSRFYEHCPVHGSKEEAERTKLVKVYLDAMTHGLGILGIDIPEEM